MTEEEWKKMMQNWSYSTKHKELKGQLDKNKNQLNQKLLKLDMSLNELQDFIVLTKKELEILLDNFINKNENINEVGWITSFLCETKTKKELFLMFIKSMAIWYAYISSYSKQEEYEICGKLTVAIELEISEFEDMMLIRFKEITQEDKDYIEGIDFYFKKQINDNS